MDGSLHETAVDAEAAIEELVTKLGQVGADEGTINVVKQMAEVARKIVKALGEGQEETPAEEPAAPQPTPPAEPSSIGDATDQMVAGQ
jgi:hypothetical protein